MSNAAKSFDILASVWAPYIMFDSSTKLFLDLVKFLDTSANHPFCVIKCCECN